MFLFFLRSLQLRISGTKQILNKNDWMNDLTNIYWNPLKCCFIFCRNIRVTGVFLQHLASSLAKCILFSYSFIFHIHFLIVFNTLHVYLSVVCCNEMVMALNLMIPVDHKSQRNWYFSPFTIKHHIYCSTLWLLHTCNDVQLFRELLVKHA